MRRAFAPAILVLCLCSSAGAGDFAFSGFDLDNDGWMVGEFLPPAPIPVAPVHQSPGGYVETADIDIGNWTGYIAPAKFLGNWVQAHVHDITFDTRIQESDGVPYVYLVVEGGGLRISPFGAPPVDNVWTSYVFHTLSAAGWVYTNDGITPGGPVSPADFIAVMSNVTAFRISSDWHTGPDLVDLDNVRLVASPEPGTLGLIATGLAALPVLLRRRRRA
ncbi:MAG: laminin B domain-containing protein [Bryobacteraceae bacterium]